MNLPKIPLINTERLCVQSIREQDQEDAIELLTNDEISKTYMLPEFQSRDEAISLFERLKQLSASENHFLYGIYLNDKMIGFINDVEVDQDEIELGYMIHPRYKGKGYATEVLKKSIEILFQLGYSVVKAGAFEENPASMRVMEKSGMTRMDQEEMIAYRGKNHRCIYYRKDKI